VYTNVEKLRPPANSSASRSAQPSAVNAASLALWAMPGLRQELVGLSSVWPHAAFLAACDNAPPSAAVRQRLGSRSSPSIGSRLHVPRGLASAPGRAVWSRKMSRDLQSWSSHGPAAATAPVGNGSLLSCLVRLRRGALKPIEWALDLGNHSDRHATVAGPSSSSFSCPSNALNDANVPAAFEQMGVAKLWRSECKETVLAQPRGALAASLNSRLN